MSLEIKDLILRSHIGSGEDGAPQLRRKALKLSLSDQESSCYIRCHNPADNADQDFELVACNLVDAPFSPERIAILHTKNGSVWLEARRTDTSFESTGCSFDANRDHFSAQELPYLPGVRPFIPIGPRQKFRIGKMTFDIVAKEHDDLAFTPSPLPEKHYTTYDSQPSDSQRSTPSNKVPARELSGSDKTKKLKPNKLGELDSRESHSGITKDLTPTLQKSRFIGLHGEESDQNSYETEGDSESFSPRCLKTDPRPLSTSEMNRRPLERREAQDSLSRKKRKLSSPPVEESQDSLAGTIHVVTQPPTTPYPTRRSYTKPKPSPIHQESPELTAESVEPNSSMRSTRSAVREGLNHLKVADEETRFLFASSTSVGDSKALTKFLREQGIKIVQSITDCTVLCVGKGELKKTSKFILAVMLGKEVITDNWVTDSAKKGELQDIGQYVARDPEREAEWGIDLEEAIERGKEGIKVLQGWTIVFTASAKKEVGKNGFSELKEIATFAGAKSVSSSLPKKGPEELPSTLVIGTQEDVNTPALDNWKVFTRDILSLSVLRGNLDTDSEEFLIHKTEQEKGSKRKPKR